MKAGERLIDGGGGGGGGGWGEIRLIFVNDASGVRQRHPAWRELVFGSALLFKPQHTATPTNGEYIPAIHGHPHCGGVGVVGARGGGLVLSVICSYANIIRGLPAGRFMCGIQSHVNLWQI